MATKRHRTSHAGVYWRESKTNGKKDKTFYITYKDENNKTVEAKVGRASEGCNITFAYDTRNTCLSNVRVGEAPPIARRRKNAFTLDDAFQEYIIDARKRKKTWPKDEEHYNNHLSSLHDEEVTSLNQKTFNDLIRSKFESGYKHSTVKHIITIAQSIINHSINNGLVKNYTNPIGKGRVFLPQPDNQKLGFLTKEQANRILEALNKQPSRRMYNMTILLLHTGARFSEVASLVWTDIDFDTELITFKATKKGNTRSIKMSHKVKEVLLSLHSLNTFLVIPSKNDTQMTQMPKKWQTIIDGIIPDNKIKHLTDKEKEKMSKKNIAETEELYEKQNKRRITTHSLRHTHATWLAKSGEFTLLDIKGQLGHKTTQMTERYSHHIPEDRHKKHSLVFD